MKMSGAKTQIFLLAMVSCFFGLAMHVAWAEQKTVVIGSGGPTGVYNPVAVAICRLFNVKHASRGYGCLVESTAGSIQNLKMLRDGSANFAIVQSDWQSHSFNGTDVFEDTGPHEELRSVFSLYSESFTVVARAGSGITRIRGSSRASGKHWQSRSGQRATMELVMKAYGSTRFTFSSTREFSSEFQAQALCDQEVDAIVFVAGHPSGTIKSAAQACNTNFVVVDGPTIEKLVEENNYYRQTTIPASVYRGQSSDIPTFGVNATMVTTSDTSAELVEAMLITVFEDLSKLKRIHPALANLEAEDMRRDIMPAPLHDAATEYYRLTVN